MRNVTGTHVYYSKAWVNKRACNREYTGISIMVSWKWDCDSDVYFQIS